MMVFIGSGPYLLTLQLYKSQRTPSRSTQSHAVFRTHAWQSCPSPLTGEGEGGGEGQWRTQARLLPPSLPFPATASAEGRLMKGGPFPASATAERPQFNGAASPARGEGVEGSGRRGGNREPHGPRSVPLPWRCHRPEGPLSTYNALPCTAPPCRRQGNAPGCRSTR